MYDDENDDGDDDGHKNNISNDYQSHTMNSRHHHTKHTH